jgi:putative spermidine/putrescine transport system permease protein
MFERLRHMSIGQMIAWVSLRLLVIVCMAYIVLPLASIIPISFSSGTFFRYPMPGVSLKWYRTIMEPYPWLFAFKNSLVIALATTVAATTLGTLAAYGFTSADFRFKPLLLALVTSPLIVPMVIIGLSAYFFMAELGLLGTFAALILTHTVIAIPFVFITVSASLQGFDRTLVRAAVSLGATPLRAFWSTTFPLNLPGIFAGAIFAFITSFDDVVIALFLASPAQHTLPLQLFSGLRDQIDPSLIAVATLLICTSVGFYGVVHLLRRWGGRSHSQEDKTAADVP